MARNPRAIVRLLTRLLLLALAGAQFVPVERDNPATEEAERLQAPDEVLAVLHRSCFDCHSHETHWPWYAFVAPVSWLVAHDVEEGRDELNFSTWNTLSPERRAHLLHEMVEVIEEGEMPPATYRPLHPDAALSAADVQLISSWVAGQTGG